MVKVAKRLGENPAPAAALLSPDTAGGTGPGGTYKAADLRTVYNRYQHQLTDRPPRKYRAHSGTWQIHRLQCPNSFRRQELYSGSLG
jgi:hypothetical protein